MEVDESSDTDLSDEDEAGIATVLYNQDGTFASGSAAEVKLAAKLASGRSRGPAGRFGGRAGKLTRIRQQEAEARARLDLAPGASAANLSTTDTAKLGNKPKLSKLEFKTNKRQRSDLDDSLAFPSPSDCAIDYSKPQRQKRCKSASNPSPKHTYSGVEFPPPDSLDASNTPSPSPQPSPTIIVSLHQTGATAQQPSVSSTQDEGWWGAKWFVSAGCMAALDDKLLPKQRGAFNEDDQAAVYTAVKDCERKGRQGLGKSTVLKIAGGSWQGQKVTFEEGFQDTVASGLLGKRMAQTGEEERFGANVSDLASNVEDWKETLLRLEDGRRHEVRGSNVKWKKLVKKTLKGEGDQRMKVKRLLKQLRDTLRMQGVDMKLKAIGAKVKELHGQGIVLEDKWIRLGL